MSSETQEWLENNTLIGYTAERGHAWHYRRGNTNHYEAAIPVEDVRRRLYSWEPVLGPVQTQIPNPSNPTEYLTVEDPDRQVVVRPDTREILGVFGSSFVPHSYDEWLIRNVETILDAKIKIGSAGLLKRGAVAWVQVEMKDTIHHKSGVSFRPFLTSATSLDGSLTTTYLTGNSVVVCDNTLSAALGSAATIVKKKHTTNSLKGIADVRAALGLLIGTADAFVAELDALTAEVVTDPTFDLFLDAAVPVSPDAGRSQTMAQNKQDALRKLWNHDTRVAPWRNSAWGVVQAMNTYQQHESIIRGAANQGGGRTERTQLDFLHGKVDAFDQGTLAMLRKVQASGDAHSAILAK